MSTDLDRYAPLLRHAPFGCVVVVDGVIRLANPEAVEATGIPYGRLLGVELGDLLVPEYHERCAIALRAASATTMRMPARLARALAPIELSVRAGEDDDGAVVVGLRSMVGEFAYSARAAAELTHDQVTGFPDRYHLLSILNERMAASHKPPIALVALWIDELSSLTSSKGESAGERIVREVSARFQARLRSPDVIGRLDEDGFLGLLTSDAPPDQLTDIAERLRGEVAFPVDVDDELVSFTASVAVASLKGRRPSVERALAQLEAASNRARSGGGNRTEVLEL